MSCIQIIFLHGLKPYYHYKEYAYQNDFSADSAVALSAVNTVTQTFVSKGNLLNSISIYVGDNSQQTINISVLNENGKEIAVNQIVLSSLRAGEWNQIVIDNHKVERNKLYRLVI